MNLRSINFVMLAALAACGGTPQPPSAPPRSPRAHAHVNVAPAPIAVAPSRPAPPKRLLAIDWARVQVTSDAEALALWAAIAPTGADWEARLEEVPTEYDRSLAVALLRAGNFACVPAAPARDCATPVYELPEPAPAAGLDDPCLRRLLALWAIAQLAPADIPSVMDALRAIVQLPPPEDQLASAAFGAVPEGDQARRLELIALAWRAGQREAAGEALGDLDEAHLVEAASQHHVDGALEMLSASTQRAVFLAALTDDRLGAKARREAIAELAEDDPLDDEVRAALVKATAVRDCSVAAAAVRALQQHGDARHLPRPARTVAGMMRALCVLASYEHLQGSDEASLLPRFVPAHGLERITITYDPLTDVDHDGDGDPHTTRREELVPRAELVMPEVEDVIRAMQHCKGTTCTSDLHELRFVFRRAAGRLAFIRLEMTERPPCPSRK